jgi:hypothetical protein
MTFGAPIGRLCAIRSHCREGNNGDRCLWLNLQSASTTEPLNERMMGVWSRAAGEVFLDWVAPRPGLRWIDVGCGNGAFTELLVEGARQLRSRGSIRPMRSSHSRAHDPRRAWPSSVRETPWRFRSLKDGLMQLSWRW